MKKLLKKLSCCLPPVLLDYFEWLFADAAENQLRITKANKNKFRSYTQLKRHQKKLKFYVGGFFLVLISLFMGLIIGPIISPAPIPPELYIPNGRGDILLGNISKNQVTMIFKTLDSANNNEPLATKAVVEVYNDENYTKLVRRTTEDDYAITHIIPVDSLQEGNLYYIRIVARHDAITGSQTKVVSSWGDGRDPIRVYTTGEIAQSCIPVKQAESPPIASDEIDAVKISDVMNESQNQNAIVANNSLQISNVMNESYLQPKNKIQTIISWNTNKPATTVLLYEETASREKIEIIINNQLQDKHAAILTTLKAGTAYLFSVKSVDKDGKTVISEQYSLRTPKPQSTISEKIKESFKSIFKKQK
ncbi:MAG: hypothetical protein HGA36_00740 [Candidatus Moranbacteria bacterium]|nr:hypothetical protein [Candidatus Moranbacteria bacterium]